MCVFFLLLFSGCFQLYYVVGSPAAVPQGSSALQSLASSLPDVALASRAPSTSSKFFLPTSDGGLGHENMA